MGSWSGFLLTYLLGGVTFIPLLLALVVLHAHLTFPVREDTGPNRDDGPADIVQPGDEMPDLKTAQKDEARHRLVAESDVAAGYFAVCREYTPMGINAKPIERSTPVGSTTVAAPSPSVYQSMYRSIFDRKHNASSPDDHKSISQRPKKAGNVFYVVLRHGHIMLFDDDEQLEVRHVVSLAHHSVSIYSGGDCTPEGELYIKRNAICLTRRTEGKEMTPDTQISKPFYLFSENCSAKEDFYFALLRNQAQTFAAQQLAPSPERFEVKNIISLVQKLHSSEDQLQTRWLNAFLGRIFLGIHKTKDIENLIREKLTKKISRVNRPSFLTRIAIQQIDTGNAAPYFTNPRLKDLNVEGECVIESDVKYTGNFRLEVAATARIDLGARFKAREVNLVLAVVLKKLEGHVYFKIKPPPSNRIWFSFQSMPKIEMTIEPIVSSRQITYTVILRQIENKIKEVVAETLVSPYWDDIPFFNTEHKRWRGGIFENDDAIQRSPDHEAIAAQLGNVDEVSQIESQESPTPSDPPLVEKSHSLPHMDGGQPTGFWSRKLGSKKAPQPLNGQYPTASTTALETKASASPVPDSPRPFRSGSLSASSPIVGTDPAHAEAFRPSSSPPTGDNAVSAMTSISARSRNNSPAHASKTSSIKRAGGPSPKASSEALDTTVDNDRTPTGQGRRLTASSTESVASDSAAPASLVPSSSNSTKSGTGSLNRGMFARKEPPSPSSSSGFSETKRNHTLAAVSNAAATAKRWGWNALQRQGDKNNNNGRKLSDTTVDLSQPMGRGQPLPPPGTPLPGPGQKAVPPRKPLAPPPPVARQGSDHSTNSERRVPPPPLPRRRRISQIHEGENPEEKDLVVEAPLESEPSSPSPTSSPAYVQPWIEDVEDLERSEADSASSKSVGAQENAGVGDHKRGGDQVTTPSVVAEEEEEDYSGWFDNPDFQRDDGVLQAVAQS
ncbi:hypothetical protein F4780DRAFT_356767 [Xylariomycetidae sp. FL0641]|nr:hypothetical protein F4780DRAFT_356767 [Xylariomycetidae sp. FL0641]